MPFFNITARSTESRARAGTIETRRGTVETPIFMPVGTLGTVKALTPGDLDACGAQIILGNTYHLYLRPGCDVIEKFGGLHRFMNWTRPILTDSGGFQIFSLARLAKIVEEGARFQSHIDGSPHLLTPEAAVAIQACLDSDIMMCLDRCIPYPAGEKEAESALELTSRWARRCKTEWESRTGRKNALFGIVQGGMYDRLRKRSAADLGEMDFTGYAVGGLSVGEPKELMLEIADLTLPAMPEEKPKYIMGVGTPEDIVDLVALGADMFDCVMPTRNARNGQFITSRGNLNICNSRFRLDTDAIDPECTCETCRNYSRSYLRHLYMARELLAYRLNTVHNIHYYMTLVKGIRSAICEDRFDEFRKEFHAKRRL